MKKKLWTKRVGILSNKEKKYATANSCKTNWFPNVIILLFIHFFFTLRHSENKLEIFVNTRIWKEKKKKSNNECYWYKKNLKKVVLILFFPLIAAPTQADCFLETCLGWNSGFCHLWDACQRGFHFSFECIIFMIHSIGTICSRNSYVID